MSPYPTVLIVVMVYSTAAARDNAEPHSRLRSGRT
jgi:hypothetical protein